MGDEYNLQNSLETFEKPNKKLFMFLGISIGVVILAIILVVLSFFLSVLSSNISETELLEGTTINLKENNSVEFKVGDEEHNIKINFVGLDFVDIVIQSEPIELRLELNELKEIDLDDDGVYDIQIKLEGIENGVPRIFIKKINEVVGVVCIENWNCTGWSNCVNDFQTRICTDLNDCVTTENKPDEETTCVAEGSESVVLTCSEQNGTICNSSLICSGSIIEASDSSKCCDGECVLETQEITDCGSNVFSVETMENMPNFDCFIEASESCTPAKLLNTFTLDFFGMLTTSTTFREIKGFEAGKCIYYEVIESGSIEYTDEIIQRMLDSGSTQEEIDEQENISNQSAQETIDLEKTCKFNQEDLTTLLNNEKDGNFSSSDWNVAECENIMRHEDENCHIYSIHKKASGLAGLSFSVSVSGFTNADSISWISEDTNIATVNSSTGSSTRITLEEGVGLTNIIATDNAVGSHCKFIFSVEVYN